MNEHFSVLCVLYNKSLFAAQVSSKQQCTFVKFKFVKIFSYFLKWSFIKAAFYDLKIKKLSLGNIITN